MLRLEMLSREGAADLLRRLCTGEARFKELSGVVANTRTLSRRLKELLAVGLIERSRDGYVATNEGFDAAMTIAELEGKAEGRRVSHEGLAGIRHRWMRVSLTALTELFYEEFGEELISVVLYGSAVKGSFKLERSDIDLLYILEDSSKNVWRREGGVFRDFQSTWEYRACDHRLKIRGTYGYPEVTTAWLQRSTAMKFQPMYLDMIPHRAVLYDADKFFEKLMNKLEGALGALGSLRIERPDGTYFWSLDPGMAPGELIEISLG
jgi:hypothetical protein